MTHFLGRFAKSAREAPELAPKLANLMQIPKTEKRLLRSHLRTFQSVQRTEENLSHVQLYPFVENSRLYTSHEQQSCRMESLSKDQRVMQLPRMAEEHLLEVA